MMLMQRVHQNRVLNVTLSDKKIINGKLGAISFIQRFGSNLNLHLHYHCVVMDGIFYEDKNGLLQFFEVDDLSVEDADAVQARVRKRVLSLYKRKGLLTEEDEENLKSWKGNGGFSVNADVRIESDDRKAAERLLRYCARPAFSGEKLTAISTFGEHADAMRLHYDINKNSQQTQPPLNLTATELLDKLAQLIPPPRRHRHHYHGVLAPNSKYRSRVTEYANQEFKPDKTSNLEEIEVDDAIFAAEDSAKLQPKKAWLNWAKLIRKVYEVDPLKCEQCGETMKLIAFILDATSIQKILSHIGEDSEPPQLHPARGPPDEGYSEGGHVPEYQYDQTVNW